MGCAVEREAETGESTSVKAAVADEAKEEAAIVLQPLALWRLVPIEPIGTTP